MNFQTRFITKDDFNSYWGTPIEELLGLSPNTPETNNIVNAFFTQREHECELYCETRSGKKYNYDELSTFQKEQFQMGILYYSMYVIKNGLVGMFSGIGDSGKTLSKKDMENAMLDSFSERYFIVAGLLDRNLRSQSAMKGGWYI